MMLQQQTENGNADDVVVVATAAAAKKQRVEALRVAKGLNKFITLPHHANWKVHQEDVLQRGRPLTLFRTKRCFLVPDAISSLKERCVTVTRHGYMVVYENPDEGLLIDLRTASNVFCTADRYNAQSGVEYMRCHIKIRLPRGNVHLFVRDEDVHKWTCAITKAASGSRSDRIPKTSTSTLRRPEGVHVETAVEQVVEDDVLDELDEQSTSSCSKITVIEKSVTALEPEPEPEPTEPTVSVRLLRRKLEKELVMRTKEDVLRQPPHFVSELFYQSPSKGAAHNAVLSEQTVVLAPAEQQHDEARKKEWWTRSLRC